MKLNLLRFILTAFCAMIIGFASAQNDNSDIPFVDLPPTDEYGKCYAKCKIPDIYDTVTRQVVLKGESTKINFTPAIYETQTKTVLVKEGGKSYRVIPATYKTVTESVLVEPERKIIKTIPAKYTTASRQVLVSEARGEWVKKKKDPNCFSKNPEDCYIACYEEVPAKYRTETYQVLAADATTVEEIVPAKYRTIKKSVIDREAQVEEIIIEPEYTTINTKVLVQPETVAEIAVPAKFQTISEKVLVKKGGYTVWTEILCASKTSTSQISRIQRALNAAGYSAGPADGILGLQTQTALKQYQTDKGLPLGNLNIETLKSLGVKY